MLFHKCTDLISNTIGQLSFEETACAESKQVRQMGNNCLVDHDLYSMESLTSSSNLVHQSDIILRRFITDLLCSLLQWEWVVLVFMESDQNFSKQLVADLFHQDMIITLTIPDPDSEQLSSLDDITSTLSILLRENENVRVLLVCRTEEGVTLAAQLSENKIFFNKRIAWIFFVPARKYIIKFFKKSSLEDVLVGFTFRDLSGQFIIRLPRESNEPSGQTDSATKPVNSWSLENGFVTYSPLFGRKNETAFYNLRGKKLKIALQSHFPFFEPAGYLNRSYMTGSDIFMLNNMAKFLNFTYEIIRPPDGQWGRLNGSHWSGMIGMVTRNEVDAALAGMSISYDRHKAVDFSVPYAFDRTTFVTKVPERRSKTWVVFWPYTVEVWFATMISLVIISLLLVFLQNKSQDFNNPDTKEKKLTLYDGLTYIFQAAVCQGYYNPQERSCQILFSAWWLFVITIVTGYNGNLMSFMTNPGMMEPIDDVPKLVSAITKGIITTGTIRDSADHAMFKEATADYMRIILNGMDLHPDNLVDHDIDGLSEVQKRSFAYIGGEMTVKADVWNPYLFLFAKDSFVSYGYGIAFRRGFPYQDAFNKKILQLRESGLVDKWMQTMIQMNQTPIELDVTADHVLNMEDLQGAFVLLGTGLVLSAIAFLLELQCYKCAVKVKRVASLLEQKKKH